MGQEGRAVAGQSASIVEAQVAAGGNDRGSWHAVLGCANILVCP